MPEIVVLMPAFNEARIITYSLRSIINQSIKPSLIIVCDNGSSDGTPEIAKKVLNESGINYLVLGVRRYPELGKYNINIVYHACANQSMRYGADYVAIIESDTVLERHYFKKLIDAFDKDGRLGMASGRIMTFSGHEIILDPFPLPRNYVGLPGSARVYRGECWRELNTRFSILRLPAWDTDHAVLITLLGWRIAKINDAVAYTRPDRPFKGFYKGVIDAMHGLPMAWALYRAVSRFDPDYLIGYLKCLINDCNEGTYKELKLMYELGFKNVLKQALNHI
jgi:glycosyltransferase involved in cell wall biosynthesis